jgi:hypothetical protein
MLAAEQRRDEAAEPCQRLIELVRLAGLGRHRVQPPVRLLPRLRRSRQHPRDRAVPGRPLQPEQRLLHREPARCSRDAIRALASDRTAITRPHIGCFAIARDRHAERSLLSRPARTRSYAFV